MTVGMLVGRGSLVINEKHCDLSRMNIEAGLRGRDLIHDGRFASILG